MALDQQRNWTISMAENLERTMRDAKAGRRERTSGKEHGSKNTNNTNNIATEQIVAPSWNTPPLHLPDEILLHILTYIPQPHQQTTLASCCLLSHQWYRASIPVLYARPHLYGSNYDPFIRTICPSKNLHVRESPLSELVKALDLGQLVHQASKSGTARLLGRTKGNLEEFRAPQSGFAMNCFPALSKCRRLKILDLSLVSESAPLPELFKTASQLHNLHTFLLPRSSGFGVHHKPSDLFSWPPNLRNLSLSGGIDAHFLHGAVTFPETLRTLTIERCPLAKGYAVTHLLRSAVRPLKGLESLRIAHMPRLTSHALDDVLFLLPQIERLSVSVDYITPAIFDEGHFQHEKDTPAIMSVAASEPVVPLDGREAHPPNLRTLELTNSGSPLGVEDKISPVDVLIAIDEGSLPKLRQVRVAKSLLWMSSGSAQDTEALADVLVEGSRRDWEGGEWVFAGMGREVYEREKEWERWAGVWEFEG